MAWKNLVHLIYGNGFTNCSFYWVDDSVLLQTNEIKKEMG